MLYGLLWITSQNVSLAYHLNTSLLWPLFGVPNLYGFRNLALPRMLAHVAVATPCAIVGLYVYQQLSSRDWSWSMRRVAIAVVFTVVVFAVPLGLSAVAASRTTFNPVDAWAYLGLLAIVTGLALWGLVRHGDGH